MTKVEEAKAAIWGQLIDSGEQKEEEANALLDCLVSAAREELKYKYDKLLEDDNYLRHCNDTLIEQINKLNEAIPAARAEGAEQEKEKWINGHEPDEDLLQRARVLRARLLEISKGTPITNANNEKPETSASDPHEPRKGK